MTTVLTLGTFDLFHVGHVRLLQRSYDLVTGEHPRVVVGLNTDAFVERYKGRAPVITYVDREWCLRACRYVDAIVPNEQADGSAKDVIEAVRPDLISVGWDWKGRDYLAQLGVTAAWLEGRGIRIVYLPYTPGEAGPSSAIRARLERHWARDLLGAEPHDNGDGTETVTVVA